LAWAFFSLAVFLPLKCHKLTSLERTTRLFWST
jgi:hypothetical protein